MKKLLIPIIAISAMMFACKKSESVNPAPTPPAYLSDSLNVYFELYGNRPPYVFYHRSAETGQFVFDTIKTSTATVKVARRSDDLDYQNIVTMGVSGIDTDTLHITARYLNKSVASSTKKRPALIQYATVQLKNLK